VDYDSQYHDKRGLLTPNFQSPYSCQAYRGGQDGEWKKAEEIKLTCGVRNSQSPKNNLNNPEKITDGCYRTGRILDLLEIMCDAAGAVGHGDLDGMG